MPIKNIQPIEKAVEQLDNGLRRGPVIRLLAILIVSLLCSVGFNIKLLMDSRERELDLMEKVIEEVRKQAPVIIEERFKPIEYKVDEIMVKSDSTLVKADSILNKADSIVKK